MGARLVGVYRKGSRGTIDFLCRTEQLRQLSLESEQFKNLISYIIKEFAWPLMFLTYISRTEHHMECM